MLVVAGLALALLRLASRRWRAGALGAVVVQIITVALALGVALNIARIGYRQGGFRCDGRWLSSVAPKLGCA